MRIKKHTKAILFICFFAAAQIFLGMLLVSDGVREVKDIQPFTLAKKEPLPFKTLKDAALLPEKYASYNEPAYPNRASVKR